MQENKSIQFGKTNSEVSSLENHAEKQTEGVEVRFDPKRGTLLLSLGGEENLDPSFTETAVAEGFEPKSELHMTVIGFKQGRLLQKAIKNDPELAEQITQLANNTEWNIQPTGEKWHLTRQYDGEEVPRESIIEIVSCPEADEFIESLENITGLGIEEQPPHVTLATRGNPQGIGVNTADDIINNGIKIS